MERSGNGDTSTSAPSSLMPNVLFREIHKNAFLKRHSSDRRTGFPRKSEKVWVVFCVHDDVEPFLEIYPDQKVALTHKPEWFASLSNALHVSPSICGNEDEFEFAVTLSFQVVRLAAPSWESMMEWVETIRNKLRELKVLCPKENIYSKMPEQKQPLLPTRDPNSPLPLPPEGPSTLLPGVELVHVETRNALSNDNSEQGRHVRDVHSRSNNHDRRPNKQKENHAERDSNLSRDTPLLGESSSTSNAAAESPQSLRVLEAPSTSHNLDFDVQQVKPRIKRAVSVPHAPSTSNMASSSNITVIEVSTTNLKDVHSTSDCVPPTKADITSEIEDDDVFFSVPISKKSEVKPYSSANSNLDETHYEHVFLPNVQVVQPPSIQTDSGLVVNCMDMNKAKKQHSTSVLISPNNLNQFNSSQDENVASTSSNNTNNIHLGNSTCVTVRSEETGECDKNCPLSPQIQSKLEKVTISGLIPRVPAKSAKVDIFKSASVCTRDTNLNVVEVNKFSENAQVMSISEEQDSTSDKSKAGTTAPAYSQVKKVHKIKAKNEDAKSDEHHTNHVASPVLRKRRMNEVVSVESQGNKKPESLPNSYINKSNVCVKPSQVMGLQKGIVSKKQEATNINISRDFSRSAERNQPPSLGVSNNEYRNEISNSTPSTSGSRIENGSRANLAKKESLSNNNAEIEPMTATVQPAVGGVISVEDIPLIGGHQRRRRRSSSSDAAPGSNVLSSRAIGGADRIRINVPSTGNLAVRDAPPETRAAAHLRNETEASVHVNVGSQSTRLTLREQQVLQLKKEILHPGGVRLQLRRKDCTGSIALVDVLNGVWVAGWKQKEHPLLYNALHIGDQVVSIGDVAVRSSADAHKLIRSSASLYVEFIIRRIPFGNVFALQRTSEGQSLGIVQEGNTAEIKDVLPNSVAARQGLTPKTPSYDGLSLTTWFLTEINGRPLNLFFKDSEVRDRLNAVGKDISILVQPHDFIKQIKKQLKNMRGYKEYIVQ